MNLQKNEQKKFFFQITNLTTIIPITMTTIKNIIPNDVDDAYELSSTSISA